MVAPLLQCDFQWTNGLLKLVMRKNEQFVMRLTSMRSYKNANNYTEAISLFYFVNNLNSQSNYRLALFF